MYITSFTSQRSFYFFFSLLLVTVVYISLIIILKDGKLETFQLGTLSANQILSGSSHVDAKKDLDLRQNVTKEINKICHVSAEHKITKPLDDFIRYPCLPGLSTFMQPKQTQHVKCARTFCYSALNISSSKAGKQSTKPCVFLKTPRGRTPFCIYPPNTDIHVSGSIQRGGQWEGVLVSNLAKFIKTKPGTEFLDIGCNIGAYTVSMAHLGINVTAIDPLLENLELLSKSLVLGGLQNNVTLIWNAASNDRKLVKFKVGKQNIGGTRIVDLNSSTALNDKSYTASTIMLDDLIPLFRGKRVAIKIDIEESEYNALLGGGKFLSEIDVVVIQIEYLFHKKGKDGPKILSYLASKGFTPYRDLGRQRPLKTTTMRLWPNDLYYLKP